MSELVRITEKVNAGLIFDEVLAHVYTSFHEIIPYDRLFTPGGRRPRAAGSMGALRGADHPYRWRLFGEDGRQQPRRGAQERPAAHHQRESVVGKGSTFSFSIPVQASE
jgi:hypothetical protein